jgi:hypothetical protein
LAVLLAYSALAAWLPPLDDELYYWCWSQQLQFSYFDHPPLIAYLIRGSTALFGNSVFAIRLPAVCASVVVVGVLWWFLRPRVLLPLVLCTPFFTFGAVLATPDSPLLLLWALYAVWLVRAQTRASVWVWILGGVLLGLGILGKYTMGLAVVAGFATFAFARPWREWYRGYAVHLAVAVVVASPILIHNVLHAFEPLQFQWAHSRGTPPAGFVSLAKFVGLQLLFFGALPFMVLVWAVRNWQSLMLDSRLRVCACLFVIPFAIFLAQSCRGTLEGNWSLVSYFTAWPLAAQWYATARERPRMRWGTRVAFAVPAAFVLFLAVHCVSPLAVVPVNADRVSRQASKLQIARELQAKLAAESDTTPLFVPYYQWTAILRWNRVDAEQLAVDSRRSHFTQTPVLHTKYERFYLFTDRPLNSAHFPGFAEPRCVAEFPMTVRGNPYGKFVLLEYSKSHARPERDNARAGQLALDRVASGSQR